MCLNLKKFQIEHFKLKTELIYEINEKTTIYLKTECSALQRCVWGKKLQFAESFYSIQYTPLLLIIVDKTIIIIIGSQIHIT